MTMPEVHPPATDLGIGGRLKQCREERKLTVQDVSAQMRLEPRIIEALEKDDYDNLPAPLYVRGYLRGYAKVLKIDPDTLLAQYESGPVAETPEIVPEIKHPTQTSSSDKPVKIITYLITLTLVVMLVTWWQSKFVVSSDDADNAGTMVQPESTQSGLGYPIKVVPHPAVPSYRAPEQDEPAAAPVTTNTADTQSAPDAGSGTTPAAGPVAAPVQQPGTGAPAASQTDQNVTVAGPDGPDHIVIHVTADSWIEVFDANEDKVYRNLARAGEVLQLSGKAPFSVLLGFAQGVSLTFNGKSFDPAPYSRSGVARFTLHN